jgi:hypothetical protein
MNPEDLDQTDVPTSERLAANMANCLAGNEPIEDEDYLETIAGMIADACEAEEQIGIYILDGG